MGKTTISITVDYDVVLELKNKSINKSDLINKFLRNYLDMKEIDKSGALLETEISTTEAKLAKLREMKAEEAKKEREDQEAVLKGHHVVIP